jgi:hypothetical protein
VLHGVHLQRAHVAKAEAISEIGLRTVRGERNVPIGYQTYQLLRFGDQQMADSVIDHHVFGHSQRLVDVHRERGRRHHGLDGGYLLHLPDTPFLHGREIADRSLLRQRSGAPAADRCSPADPLR